MKYLIIGLLSVATCFADLFAQQIDMNPMDASRPATSEFVASDGLTSGDEALVNDAIEALDLLYGQEVAGANALRLDELEIRLRKKDTNLPETVAYELAALFEHRKWDSEERPSEKDFSQRLRSWADVEKQLILEFPSQPIGYEGLMSAAEHAAKPEVANGIAQEILHSDKAPGWVKDRAQVLLTRNDLVGLSLADLLENVWPEGATLATASGKVVVYSWSAEDLELNQTYINQLDKLSEDSTLLGICLDDDLEAAKRAADVRRLPGFLFFSEEGRGSLCAQRLCLNLTSLIYTTDSEGLLRLISRHTVPAEENGNQPSR